MTEHRMVITSWPDFDGAERQARDWVEKKLAASVNILPKMDSIYRWKGELRHGSEHKMFVKTVAGRVDELRNAIRHAHPYAVAEILVLEIDSGDPDYLQWITRSTT
jgi:periplasmic divalent cation tolerance protein